MIKYDRRLQKIFAKEPKLSTTFIIHKSKVSIRRKRSNCTTDDTRLSSVRVHKWHARTQLHPQHERSSGLIGFTGNWEQHERLSNVASLKRRDIRNTTPHQTARVSRVDHAEPCTPMRDWARLSLPALLQAFQSDIINHWKEGALAFLCWEAAAAEGPCESNKKRRLSWEHASHSQNTAELPQSATRNRLL